MSEPIYNLDLDEEFLSHLPNPEAWLVINAEQIDPAIVEDDFTREVFVWQRHHLREYGQPATATVLANHFDLDLVEPETQIGDLLDRMREQYARNQGREALREIIKAQQDDAIGIPRLLLQKGRELNALLTKRGEMFASEEVMRAQNRYDKKVLAGPGASIGFAELDEYFYGMQRGVTLWIAPPKTMKALALDTPIPTPQGWTTMGDLQVGNRVFDQAGQSCNVLGKSDVYHDRPCYRVRFSDHTEIIADADHLWETKTHRSKGQIGIHTTKEIQQTIKRYGNGRGWNHSIFVTQPLQCPEEDLPLDPYVLGVWLGDGHTREASITITDPTIFDNIREAGFHWTQWLSNDRVYTIHQLSAKLRYLNVLGNKHIPTQYLRASYGQRLSLLQGLMDTDGTCCGLSEISGDPSLSTSNPHLRDDALELMRSLGFKPVAREYRATLNRKDCGPTWHIGFTAHNERPVFRIPYKYQSQRTQSTVNPQSQTRQIVAVEPVTSVPVQCITVDSSRNLYLAGTGMIPTHNSWIMCKGVLQNAIEGRLPHIYSLELPAEETDMRLRCLLADVPWWHYIRNRITKDEWKNINEATDWLHECGMYRVVKPPAGGRGMDEMIHQARDAGAGVIFIDQLQYVENSKGQSIGSQNNTGDYWEVLNRARDLSDDGPICFAHQFNRSAMFSDEMPRVEQAKGSSSIEEVATLALGMWANKDMRRSGIVEIGTLIARNHEYAAWNMEFNLSHRCNFEIIERADDKDE